MKLFAGLGNPGAKYARNRHNIGFMAIDRIAGDHGFAPFRRKFQAEVTEGRLGSERVILLKPMTFMNLSGQAVGEALRFYKLEPTDLTVFHDEIDLTPGKVRLKSGGGHAGHNGLRSIHQHCGPHYDRVRLGVGHPGRKEAVPGWVLHDFAKHDEDWLDDVLRGIGDGAPALAEDATDRFLNAVALRVAPPRSGTGAGTGTGQSPKQGARPPERADGRTDGGAAPPPGEDAAPQDAPDAGADDRSALRRLADRFR